MGVLSFSLVFSLILFEVTFVHALDEGGGGTRIKSQTTTTTQKIIDSREPPTIEIGVTVVSNRHSLETNNSQENSEFWILVDTWWKIWLGPPPSYSYLVSVAIFQSAVTFVGIAAQIHFGDVFRVPKDV